MNKTVGVTFWGSHNKDTGKIEQMNKRDTFHQENNHLQIFTLWTKDLIYVEHKLEVKFSNVYLAKLKE